MKFVVYFVFLAMSCSSIYAQSDTLRQLYGHHPLIQTIDSISFELQRSGKTVELVLGRIDNREYSGVIIWKEEKRSCGLSFRKKDNALVKRKVRASDVRNIRSSRLFSDSCNLCGLLDGRKKANILDLESVLVLRLSKRQSCKEIFFLHTSFMYYGSGSCVYDLRLFIGMLPNTNAYSL